MPALDPERSLAEAARRARGKVRRYCAANRLNRLGTLTFRGAGCHDEQQLRVLVGRFFRRLREQANAGEPMPYVWVPEWHKSGHGLHVHFAVGRFIKRSIIDEAWGHGFVHIKLLGDLPVGSGAWAEARHAARYLSKYIGKDFGGRQAGQLHRYEVAQKFQPKRVGLAGESVDEVIAKACERMGGPPAYCWTSDQQPDWKASPAVWLSWA